MDTVEDEVTNPKLLEKPVPILGLVDKEEREEVVVVEVKEIEEGGSCGCC